LLPQILLQTITLITANMASTLITPGIRRPLITDNVPSEQIWRLLS
jgi:hypothetical protein